MRSRIDKLPPGVEGALAVLHRACFPEDPWNAEVLGVILAMPGAFGRVSWLDMGRDKGPDSGGDALLDGFVLARDLGGECEILSLGVDPRRRRAGLGRLLLDAARDEARLCGARSLVLEVAADNAAARGLYRALGFAPVGRRRHYYRRSDGAVDALILRLTLLAPPRAEMIAADKA